MLPPVRRPDIDDALAACTDALQLADEIFIRMVVWAAGALISFAFGIIFDWAFIFPGLMFAAAWVAAAGSREKQLRCAANWQNYLDDREEWR